MLTPIQDAVQQLLPAKRKTSSSGWTSFNAVCCEHNGESRDTRGRGGVISNSNGSVSYACFNCNFKANYTPGRHLNYKFRKLLSWFGADENTIKRLVIDAIRVKELVEPETANVVKEEITFTPRPLPESAQTFRQWHTYHALHAYSDSLDIPEDLMTAIRYVHGRKINLKKYEFYWTDKTDHNYHKRVIIPCYWQGQIIGSTSRSLEDNIKPKYYADYEPNYVFNVDRQNANAKFVIVAEGPFDAMAVDGVAVLSNECSEVQADIIDSLGREVIVVPDRDKAGTKLIDDALEYGWSVSFPVWQETCKDINDAVVKYGKLFVIKSILDGRESSRLKIELKKKKILHDSKQ